MSGFGIMMNSSLQGLNVIDDATITDFSDLLRSNTSILDSDALTADVSKLTRIFYDLTRVKLLTFRKISCVIFQLFD